MDIDELNKLSLDRLFNLSVLELKNLEHYIVRDDLYKKEDVFKAIEKLVIINSFIKMKMKKLKKYQKIWKNKI